MRVRDGGVENEGRKRSRDGRVDNESGDGGVEKESEGCEIGEWERGMGSGE